jgi:hypothetical protein
MWRVHQRHCEWIAKQVYNRIKGEEFDLNINKLPPIVVPRGVASPPASLSEIEQQWAHALKMSNDEFRRWRKGADIWRQRKNSP